MWTGSFAFLMIMVMGEHFAPVGKCSSANLQLCKNAHMTALLAVLVDTTLCRRVCILCVVFTHDFWLDYGDG